MSHRTAHCSPPPPKSVGSSQTHPRALPSARPNPQWLFQAHQEAPEVAREVPSPPSCYDGLDTTDLVSPRPGTVLGLLPQRPRSPSTCSVVTVLPAPA